MPATQTAEPDPYDGVEQLQPDPEARVAELEDEVEHLRRALASRTVIATAVGLLAERHRCTSDQAWLLLASLSNHANRKALHVAQVLVSVADGDLAADEVQAAAELARHLPAALASAKLDAHRGPA